MPFRETRPNIAPGENRGFLDQRQKSKLIDTPFSFPVDVDRVELRVTILSTIRIVKAKNAVSPRVRLSYMECSLRSLNAFLLEKEETRYSKYTRKKRISAIRRSLVDYNWKFYGRWMMEILSLLFVLKHAPIINRNMLRFVSLITLSTKRNDIKSCAHSCF